ncbi:MAG: sugar transferase [Syntrophorhabdaceae bacterium]|nr:sugar transferase [Syntrophorhabdaceae bacterium]
MARVSVIICVFNGAAVVSSAVDSIKAQTFTDWECIICDDASRDNTWDVLLDVTRGDGRFVLIRNEVNRGPAYSRNRCIEKAGGELIAIQDADDASMPDRLEKQVGLLDRRQDVSVAGSFAQLFDGDGTPWGELRASMAPEEKDWLKGSQVIHASVMVRKEDLKQAGLYDENIRIAEDYDLFTRLVARGRKVVTLPEFLYAVRWDASSYGRKGMGSRWQEATVRCRIARRLTGRWYCFIHMARPLLLGLVPSSLLFMYHKRVLRRAEGKVSGETMIESARDKKKVCFVATLEMSIRAFLADHMILLQDDFDLCVVCATENTTFLEQYGIKAKVIPVPIERNISLISDVKALLAIHRIFREERFDIVHSIMPKSGLLAMAAGFLARVPIRVHTFTGQVWKNLTGVRRFVLKTMDRVLVGCATHILVDSPSQREFLIAQGIVGRRGSAVIGNGSMCGVDSRKFHFDDAARQGIRDAYGIGPRDVVFFFLGRMNRDKGVLDLARAFAGACASFGNVHLVLAGPDEENMREKVLEICSRCSDRVHITGPTDAPEGLMSASDVLCLPSYREGFGLVVIEAAAVGIPSIGSRIYGVTDAIEEGVTGFLFEAGSHHDLMLKMVKFVEDPSLARRMGEKARAFAVERFSRERITAAMLDYYRILGRRVPQSFMKRVLDVVLSLIAIIALGIPMLVIALVIYVSMGSPVLFRQVRPGFRGKPFSIMKFRTMNEARDLQGRILPDEARLTGVGRVVRSLSLDELPQLFNVLMGDLSFVGPRPLLMQYMPLYNDHQARRHEVKPGITGWAQVHGRNAISWEEKFDLDVWYVDHASLALDLRILWLTAVSVVKREGISAEGFETMPEFKGSERGKKDRSRPDGGL